MPRGDGSGPLGMEPITGRGTGFCAGFKIPGYANARFERQMWFRRGRGYRRMLWLAEMLPGCAYLAY